MPHSSPPSTLQADTALCVAYNPWEWQDSYDEKADIWQVKGGLKRGGVSLSLSQALGALGQTYVSEG